MSDTIIKVEGLSKRYIIGHETQERYLTLRDTVAGRAKKIFSFPSRLKSQKKDPSKEEFWALKNIDFEIKKGERVGIIGRNGAGKSTLLKILSRITEPSSGRINIRGRAASLLEVGTGFHPELSGRENIYLNGAILGMSRAEIRLKFDEIVSFAEVEKFLDTPVKRYSSGMYVRLAFSVAAHLEPEILIVDEVLAVGDAQFQKKSLGKMEDVSRNEGRTIILVSHNMAAIKGLCTDAIFLHKGEKVLQGNVYESLEKYLSFDQTELNRETRWKREKFFPPKNIYVQEAELIDDQTKDKFSLLVNLKIYSSSSARIGVNFRIKDGMGFPIALGCVHYDHSEKLTLEPGDNEFAISSFPLNMAIGAYKLSIEIVFSGSEVLDTLEDCIQFELNNEGLAKRKYGLMQSWGYGSTEIIFSDVKRTN